MRKYLKLITVFILSLTIMSFTVAAEPSSGFEDVDYSTPVGNAVDVLVELNVTNGVSDTRFGTNDLVTRQQMAAFIYRLMNDGESPEGGENLTPFTDLEDATFFPMISWANQQGIINGTSDTLFNPKGSITLRDAYAMICRALGHKDLEYPAGYITTAEDALHLNAGIGDALPYTEPLTRGSVAILLYNAYSNLTIPCPEPEPVLPLTLTAGGVEVKKGTTTVEVPVTVTNNPGFAGATFEVEFDSTALAVKGIAGGDFDTLTITPGEGSTSPFRVVLANYAGNDVAGDGILCTITFDVSPAAKEGNYEIKLNSNDNSKELLFTNEKLDILTSVDVAGAVNVVPKPFPPILDEYLQEDVDNSGGKVVAIGKKKPLYVVAIFNEDFSSVIIKKNGKKSNGIMVDWDKIKVPSPMVEKKKTLETVIIEDGVKNIGNRAFNDCDKLTEITFPESVATIGKYAFDSCSSLVDINMSEKMTTISENAFSGCSTLETVVIPEGVKTIGNSAFESCSKLKSISLPETLTKLGAATFSGCTLLEEIVVPGGVKTIERATFDFCLNLSSVTLSSGTTAINELAFYKCHILSTLIVPDTIKKFGENAFLECSMLREIKYQGTKKQWKAVDFKFSSLGFDRGVCAIVCKNGRVYEA